MKLNHILSCGAIALLTGSAWAAPLSPEQALARAVSDGPTKIASSQRAEFKLADTRMDRNTATVYLFTAPGDRFLVLSADDVAAPVAGYGTAKLTDADGNYAPNFEYWLDFLSSRVASAAKAGMAPYRATEHEEWPAIEPLCSTQWGQDEPYNNMCPQDNGVNCVTGCVATAMAQAMKYHNWPETGTGSVIFHWNRENLFLDYEATTFDWANMLDSYRNGYTETESDAVALLMKACGFAVDMEYTTTASGASSFAIAPALINYFKYDKSIRYLMRDLFTLEQWEMMIYTSLQDCGPVIYDGQSRAGGHSFICDGYDKDGYFHINWGWEGLSDGYFLLDVLDPQEQGTGGSDYDFNSMQDAVLGIRPDVSGDSEGYSLLGGYGDMNVSFDSSNNVISYDGYILNYGPFAIYDGTIGLATQMITPEGDCVDSYEYDMYYFGDLPLAYGFTAIDFDLSEYVEAIRENPGTKYDFHIVYTTGVESNDVYHDVLLPSNIPAVLELSIIDGTPYVTVPGESPASVKVSLEDTIDSIREYYTLEGVHAGSAAAGSPRPDLAPGLYIERNGSASRKILVK